MNDCGEGGVQEVTKAIESTIGGVKSMSENITSSLGGLMVDQEKEDMTWLSKRFAWFAAVSPSASLHVARLPFSRPHLPTHDPSRGRIWDRFEMLFDDEHTIDNVDGVITIDKASVAAVGGAVKNVKGTFAKTVKKVERGLDEAVDITANAGQHMMGGAAGTGAFGGEMDVAGVSKSVTSFLDGAGDELDWILLDTLM